MKNRNQAVKKRAIAAVSMSEMTEGQDFYINEKGLFVFMEAYHLKRGFCCESGCQHCPYGFKERKMTI